MKKHATYLILCMGIGLLLAQACSSGKAALRQGDYYRSVITSVNRLRSNPNHKKSIQTLRDAYPLAVRYELGQANLTIKSTRPFKYEDAIGNYERLNHMYDEIRRSPGALSIVPNPAEYLNQLESAKQNAAPERYNAGLAALDRDNRQDARQAFYHFQIADRLIPGYRDVARLMDEAREAATLKVVLEQIPVPSRRYQLSADFFQDQVESYLVNNQRNEFVRFFTPGEVQRMGNIQPDQIVRLQFEDFSVGNIVNSRNTEEFTRDSVRVGETTTPDGEKLVVWGTVKAKLTTNRSEVISNGILAMQIIDTRSRNILASDRFRGEFVWFIEWGSYQGDERALTQDQLRITELQLVPPPPAQELFIEFTRPIYGQLTNRLNSFYRQF